MNQNEENTLHFKITVDGNGLKDIQNESQAAFRGIKKGVEELSSKSVDELQNISLELMEVVDKFNQLAKAVGVDPKFLRQTLNQLREIREATQKLEAAEMSRYERLQNAESKLIRQQIANLEAERRSKEKQAAMEFARETELAKIKQQNIAKVNKMRHDGYTQFINQINAENKKIKEQGDKAVAEFEKVLEVKKRGGAAGFAAGASNVFSGSNYGTFSNILGGFGGGGRILGSVASGLDGAASGGGSIGGIIGGAAAGAGIGAIIVGLTTMISLLKSAASAAWEFAKSAVGMAGDFEETINSIAVFSGGVIHARNELTLLQGVVERTTGLSLEGAESGYKQLRALGFEAENSRKLIEGLGKIKITSGATEQSVERVIVNLTQLSSSTARAGQDIKEIIHALPAMRQVFRDTFGTSEAPKLKALIEKDGDEFFKKLAEGMEKFKGASGGMNDALVKLNNQWIINSREFGKAIVPTLTVAIKDLTVWLTANKDEFKLWGSVVSNVLKTITALLPSLISGFGSFADTLDKAVTGGFLGNIVRGVKTMIAPGLAKERQEAKARAEQLKNLPENQRGFFEGLSSSQSFESQLGDFLKENREAQYIAEDKLQDKLADLKEKQRKKDLESLEDNYALQKVITEGFYQVQEARVNANLTYTSAQELEKVRTLTTIRQSSIKSQIDDAKSYYASAIALQSGNDIEIRKLTAKRNEDLAKLGLQLEVEQINSQRQIAEAEQKILDERRQAQIEFVNIQIETAKFGYEKATTEINRGLSKQTISIKAGYDTLKTEAVRYFNDLRDLMTARYQLQLEDKRLSDEQRANIQEKMNLEELQLERQKSDALRKIQDDRLAAEDARRQKSLQRIKSYLSSVGSMIGNVTSTFFNPEKFSSGVFGSFRNLVIGNDADKRNKLIADAEQAQREYDTTRKRPDTETSDVNAALARLTQAKTAAEESKKAFEEYGNALPKVYDEFDTLGAKVSSVVGEFRLFDEIAKKALASQQELERTSLEMEIGNIRQRLAQARNDYVLQLEQDKYLREQENRRLVPGDTITDSVIAGNLARINGIKEELAGLAENPEWLPGTDKVLELSGELQQLGLNLQGLKISQKAQEAELFANSIEGLSERLALLNRGDAGAVNGVLDKTAKDVLRERISLVEENIELEAKIAIVGEDSATRYRNAWLTAIYDIKQASEEAKESQIRSQVEIANQTVFNADVAKAGILEAMAGAKGYTEIFQDAFLAVNQKITDGISSLLHKATDGLGVFGDVLADIASQLLTMVTNRLMMKLLDMLLPTSAGVSGASGGGFSLGGILSGIGGALGINLGNRGGGGAGNVGGSGGGNNSSALGAMINSVLPGFARGNALASVGNFGGADAFSSVSSITSSDTLTGSIGGSLRDAWMKPTSDKVSTAGFVTGFDGKPVFGGGFSLGNLGKSFGAMAPMLGLSLGAGLGGSSVPGQIIGGVGGLAGGALLSALLSGSLTGAATGGMFAGAGLLGLSALGGITLAAAPLLMIGGYLLGRNKQRRSDEKTRTEYILDAFKNLDDILAKVKSHDITGTEAISAAEQVREQYRQQASSLKSDKTRRIALKEINDRINPRIEAIREAAKLADTERTRFSDLELPEFATGGIVPGRFGEPRLVLAHGGEIIANPSQQTPTFLQAASDAGIPGVKGSAGNGAGNNQPTSLNVTLELGTDTQNKLFVNGAKSREGYTVIIEQTGKKDSFRDSKF